MMNDKDIRAILISYLSTVPGKVRIFQEKNIGSSICDVMVVSNILTGYEIKSDRDDLRRLFTQVPAYDNFFDRVYLVVSNKYKETALSNLPKHWGVMCIEEDNVTVVRKAKTNPNVSRNKQLSILWKLELKNILVRNRLPLYAEKSKTYIAGRIVKSVPHDILGAQIANELMNRDYSEYQATDNTIHVETLPETDLVDTLSEVDLSKYTLDQWIGLYRQAQQLQTIKEKNYRKHGAGERQPHVISYKYIEARPGVPWISEEIINDFIDSMYSDRYVPITASYEEITGNWYIENKNWARNVKCTVEFGTRRYNAMHILEATMNLRSIKIYDNKKYNEYETLAALEKQKLLIAEFQRWLWEDEDRIWEVEEAYNNMFTAFSKKSFDGSQLEFPEMAPSVHLYDYQKDAVERILNENNTLLAFDVGSGKTYIMIAAAMKMRQMELSRKNLFVVPNHIVSQWEKIFCQMYPSAKVLCVDPGSFHPELRQKVLAQIRDGDYDGIIMAYSCFEMIPLSEQVVRNKLEKDLEEIREALGKNSFSSSKRLALVRKENDIKKLAQKLIEDSDYSTGQITFDQLEINTLFLDEAHNYKNIPIYTQLKDLRGINTKGSSKCLDMQEKIAHIQQWENGRGVVLATGTPICNSISDVYAMQLYLQPDAMKECRLDVFDNWVKTFASPEQLCEVDVDVTRFRVVRRFAKFFNLPELSRMFSDVAIFHAVNETDLPNLESYTDVTIPKSEALTDYMMELSERTKEIRSGKIDRKYDNMLKISTDGRKAALDLNLVNGPHEQTYDEKSKLYHCVKNAVAQYNNYPDCTQLIFCDYSTPKSGEFNVYDKVKEMLVECGVDKKEIAFIHSYKTEERKLKLFREVNEGKIRILIGSTFKLGIGANVQTKLKAIHHLDVPWRPADMVQREGRILRSGNENDDVFIFRYIAEGSFDSYSWQILETKQRFISQFLSGSTYERETSDLEENVLTYSQVKAIALSQPLMKKRAELENEMRNLNILIAKQREAEQRMMEELPILQAEAVAQRQLLEEKKDRFREKRLEKEKAKLNNLENRISGIQNYKPEVSNEQYTNKVESIKQEIAHLDRQIGIK